ncbi:MAG: polysaccharide deacetylase family protein [Burkholderiaceae bacterium]
MADLPGHSVRARAPYRSIVDRRHFSLPGNARVVVWPVVNIEVWDPTGAMPRTVLPPPMGQPLLPDIPNWTWHEYGMRVGFWRVLEALRERGLPATLALNGAACSAYGEVCRAALDAGWEFMGHGLVQRPMHRLDDPQASIRAAIDEIARTTGRPPRGWESPGLTQTDDTLDHLAAAGIEYVADWVLDDQPVTLQTASGSIVAMPYSVEINDVVISAVQQHASDEIYRRGVAQFDRLWEEGATVPRVMTISLHPYLSGVPHRIGHVERLLDHIAAREDTLVWTGEQILDWTLGQPPAAR